MQANGIVGTERDPEIVHAVERSDQLWDEALGAKTCSSAAFCCPGTELDSPPVNS